MVSFPVLPMMVLVVSLLSAWFVELSLSSYVGYMVEHLGIVDNKGEAGEWRYGFRLFTNNNTAAAISPRSVSHAVFLLSDGC